MCIMHDNQHNNQVCDTTINQSNHYFIYERIQLIVTLNVLFPSLAISYHHSPVQPPHLIFLPKTSVAMLSHTQPVPIT